MDFAFDSFFGWISEDDKLVRDGQVLYAENLDLLSNSSYITCSPKPESLFTYASDIEAMYFLKRNRNKLIVGTDDNKIFRDDDEVYTNPNEVRAFWSNSEYLYWVDTAENVSRIPLANVNDASWSSNVEITETNLNTVTGEVFIEEDEDNAYLFYGDNIFEIINSTGQIANEYTFLYDTVAGIISLWSSIWIIQKDRRMFVWDKISDAPNQKFRYAFDPAIVMQTSTKNYIIAEGGLYRLNGDLSTDAIASSYNSDALGTNKFNFKALGSTSIGYLKNVSYIWVDDIDTIESVDSNGSGDDFAVFGDASVCTVWVKKSGFPDAITKFLNTSSDGSRYTEIFGTVAKSQAANGSGDGLYIAYENANGVRGVDFVDLDEQNYTTCKEGLLVLPLFDWGNKSLGKKFNKIKIRADFQDNGEIYCFKVRGNDLEYINGTAENSKFTHSDTTELKEITLQNSFYDETIALFIKQDHERTKDRSIKLYSVTPYYEPIGR